MGWGCFLGFLKRAASSFFCKSYGKSLPFTRFEPGSMKSYKPLEAIVEPQGESLSEMEPTLRKGS